VTKTGTLATLCQDIYWHFKRLLLKHDREITRSQRKREPVRRTLLTLLILLTRRVKYSASFLLTVFLLADSLLVLTSQEGQSRRDTNSGQVLNSTSSYKCSASLFSSLLSWLRFDASSRSSHRVFFVYGLVTLRHSRKPSSPTLSVIRWVPIKMYEMFQTSVELIMFQVSRKDVLPR
jgi:hypothetical protein